MDRSCRCDCCCFTPAWLRQVGLGVSLTLGVLGLVATPSVGTAKGAGSEVRPSILLVVLDTVRADAVSSYGQIEGTTPTVDRLADEGVRYEIAFSSAPWTLPSHATIFTGRRVDEHQVAMPGHPVLTDEFETLAEKLSEAGYETAAFSENAIVSDLYELLRGFEVRVTSSLRPDDRDAQIHQTIIDARDAFQKWIRTRDSSRPFFAFVNILDAHRPYEIRSQNRWVPADARPHSIKDRRPAPERLLCRSLPTAEQIRIQRGLYLGDVHAADRKFSEILGFAREEIGAGRLITVVTSDHGELFGENRLMGHEFSLHSALLRVPLVVHGVEGASGQIVETPVGLEDLLPSLLGWVGVSIPDGLSGFSLPLARMAGEKSSRMFFSAYTDRFLGVPPKFAGRVQPKNKDRYRQTCTPADRVFGGMAALIQYPFKYVWYENYPASLYDLSWDSAEISDQITYKQDLFESFEARMRPLRAAAGMEDHPEAADSELSREAIDALKQLGYIE